MFLTEIIVRERYSRTTTICEFTTNSFVGEIHT